MTVRSRPKAHQRGTLNRQVIAEAALALIDEAGTDGLTMRALGQRLGVEAMALYHHFPSRDALLDAVVGIVEGRYEIPEAGTWREQLQGFYESQVAEIMKHPNTRALIVSRPAVDPATFRALERIISVLREAGLSPREALTWMRCFVAYSNGATAALVALGPSPKLPPISPGDFPNITEARRSNPPNPAESLRAGVEAILDAIGAAIEAARRRNTDHSRK